MARQPQNCLLSSKRNKKNPENLYLKMKLHIKLPLFISDFFFYQGFLSQTLTTHRTAGEGRGPSFIPLYHFHPPTNIQIFILHICTWYDYHIFVIPPLVFTRLLLDEIYHLIESLFDWFMIWCWFWIVYLLIWFEVFVTVNWHWKPVDWDSYQLTSLYYKRTVLVIKTKTLKLVFLEYSESRK